MTDFDAAAADESQMLGPALGAGRVDQPRDAIEPPRFDGHCRGEAERHAMQHHSDLRRQCLQCPQIAPRRVEILLGNNLDQIDLGEMCKYPRSQFGAPTEPEPVAALNCRRTRHSRLHLHPRNPIRTMIRNRPPS